MQTDPLPRPRLPWGRVPTLLAGNLGGPLIRQDLGYFPGAAPAHFAGIPTKLQGAENVQLAQEPQGCRGCSCGISWRE